MAVKVQRPGVLEEISCDLFVLRSAATLLQNLPSVKSDLEAVLDNWASRFFDELDYIQEAFLLSLIAPPNLWLTTYKLTD